MNKFLYLHEKTGAERLPDVDVVVLRGELGRSSLQVESVHDPAKLLPDVVGRLQRSIVDEVVVTPLRVLHILKEKIS